MSLLRALYGSNALSRIFHTLPYTLMRELRGCETVLDLGCGPSSPVQYCACVRHSVGVEPFGPYVERARQAGTHSEVIHARIEDLDYPQASFDAVVMIEVLEHLDEDAALATLRRAERWAKKKVIVTSPNGFVPQGALDGNELQAHRSGWPLRKMRELGFRSVGLAGLKWLRYDVHSDTMADDYFATIRWRPRALWFAIAALSQLLTYRVPALAFGLFSTKEMQR